MVAGASGQIGREIVQNLSKSNKIFAIYRKKKNFFDLEITSKVFVYLGLKY